MLRIIKCAAYIAVIYGIVGVFRYINEQRDELAASVQQMAGELADSAKDFMYQTTDEVRNAQQDFNDTLQEETHKYISELAHPGK